MSCKGNCSCSKDECRCGQCNCGCENGHHAGFERRFATKAEMLEELEYYLSDLKNEVQAVEERIADLKK